MMNETDMVKRAQSGDPEAFEQLYDRFYTPVYTYIYYRVGDQALAEDLTSDVFERMVMKIDNWKPMGKPFIAWLYTIAGNLIRNHLKRQNRIKWFSLNDGDEDTGESLMTQIGKKLQHEQLARALTQLTEEQQQVIILRFLQGESIAAVAAAIGKTETGIKALQRRAIKSLGRILEKEGVHVTT